ncbi:MOSC domain-containing protein [Microscilla marina]|uniref:Oxidoreductase n=1 Tax=Microscilla marina ATCC 23134 TaxID=313606 RepID=A1ZUU7_MICM2|nr:MOSC domain-containing protein [Microscilla marina]EAY25851.1 oxidoreductase [Microscilla marina ATCC 23134]
MSITLANLYTYPVKSIPGVSHRFAEVQDRGLELDRRWMIVDSEGVAITQRQYPKIALLKQTVTEQGLVFEAPGMSLLRVLFGENTGKSTAVNIWKDTCNALVVSSMADVWFSDFLGATCQLVYMPDTTQRLVEKAYNINQHITSFSDAYPFLLISEASLADLNSRMEKPVPMNRFRPNLVVSGTDAFAEDTWKKIKVGEIIFHVVKPCARCVLTTVDQATGIKGIEPLRTLSQYRKVGTKVMFGQNLLPENKGQLSIGDKVEVLEIKDRVEA